MHAEALNALRAEHDRVCAEIRAIESNNDKIINLGVTLITVGFLYGATNHIEEIYFFLPLAIFSVYAYATLQYYFIAWFGGYKKNIEEEINHIFGHKVLIWEHVREQRPALNLSFISVVGIYTIIFFAVIVYCVIHICTHYGQLVSVSYLVCMIAISACIPKLIISNHDDYNSSYRISKKISNQNVARLAGE
jgi:hypothetical protein